jgi:hypothetical protein
MRRREVGIIGRVSSCGAPTEGGHAAFAEFMCCVDGKGIMRLAPCNPRAAAAAVRRWHTGCIRDDMANASNPKSEAVKNEPI